MYILLICFFIENYFYFEHSTNLILQEEETSAPPTEMHPLLPVQGDSPIDSTTSGSAETAIQESTGEARSSTNPTSEEDVTDDCCRRSTPPCADDAISSEPKSGGGGGEYKAIIDMLKDAEKCANDPEYEEKVLARRFGAIKYNPRNQESRFGAVDYLCTMFQCCAVCIEG